MSAYLAYSYSSGLTVKESYKIDLKTKKSREKFRLGFSRGFVATCLIYLVYELSGKRSASIGVFFCICGWFKSDVDYLVGTTCGSLYIFLLLGSKIMS